MKRIVLALLMAVVAIAASAQAKKPTIMVMPSDLWCNKNGYMEMYNNQGVEEAIPNYQKALINNSDLIPVISQINGLMADRGFPLKNLESEIKSINQSSAEMAAITSKDGASLQISPLQQLRQRANADIIIQITWTINKMGPKSSVTYTMQGLDSYTNKEIATSTGTGAPSFTAEVPVLLQEAVNAHIDEFCDRLQRHFDDLFANGREIALSINVFENDENIDLETEIGGKELREQIEDWVNENTVSHRYHLADDSETHMNFDEVRIPVYDEKGRAISANNFARSLVKYLKGAPCNISKIKAINQGQGKATLVIGNK